MAARQNAASDQGDTLLFTRRYAAPRALVFAVWTDPVHIGSWWGPEGFSTTTYRMEVRPGGIWDYVMHGPDGTDYPGRGLYSEVLEPERLVFSHVGGKAEDPHLTCEFTVTFEERDGGTELTLRMTFPSAAAAEHARELGAWEGGLQSLERLAETLAETES